MIQLRHQRVGTISLVQHNLNPRVDLHTTGACIEETISGYPQHMLTHPINITNNKRTNQVMHEGPGGSEPAGVPTHRVGDETSGDAHVPDHIRVVHPHHPRVGLPLDNMLPPLLPQNNAACMPCRPFSTSGSSTTSEAVQGHIRVARHKGGLMQVELTHDPIRSIPLNHFKAYEWDHSTQSLLSSRAWG